MTLYCGIDLHSNNSMISLIDETDRVVSEKRLDNTLEAIEHHLRPFQDDISGIVVESTYNWYWLVDGLMEKEHRVHLANTAAIQQYEGLKYTDDDSDARWLAHLFRLGVLRNEANRCEGIPCIGYLASELRWHGLATSPCIKGDGH